MIFAGNPGTAKTTVAKYFAGIAKEKGILKSGAFVERGGMDLGGFGCVREIREAFIAARGGVLFIDEAYAMTSSVAITVLLQEMENQREHVIVILAGYNERMKAFMELNEGLKSRIPYWIDFPDYTTKELTDIFTLMLQERGFCATEDAAERMRVALVNQNSDMVQKNPDYVVRITGSDTYGKSKLDYFISVREKYPVIATTSKLLSTGSDCKMTKLIVLDEMIGSMTEFKQIIGRGTRLREKEGKTHFVVMDFRNVSRLFADPDWDGPIEMDEDFNPKSGSGKNTKPPVGPGPDPVDPKQPKPIVNRDGCQVKIVYKTVSVYDANGKLLRQESIIDYTKENILGAYASLDNFIRKWSAEEKKEKIRGLLREQGIDLETLKEDQGMSDVDDFDFICHVAFDKKPLTRKERAENVKKRDFLNKYSGAAREVLEALLDKYMNTGIYEIEKTEILKLDPFMRMGKPQKIASYFGGKDGYLKAVKELENAIYDGGAA
mgnify:CR=1 FL=1